MRPFRRRKKERRRQEEERRAARRRALAMTAEQEYQPTRRGIGEQIAGGSAVTREALGKGLGATGRRARGLQPRLAGPAGRIGGLLRGLAALVFRLLARIDRLLRGVAGGGAARLGAVTAALSRALTPERAVFCVILAAAACLVVSQFDDYRGVEIGQPAYTQVADIAPPPQVDTKTAGEAHAYLLIPLAAIGVALAAVALRRRRWQLGRVVALCGIAAIAVILLVDLPKGLDEGSAGIRYNGAHATLGDAFYAELAAAGGLVLCGFLLSFNLRRTRRPAPRARRPRRRQPRAGKARSLARSGT